ncbi:MAG: response regulator transcription factor [Nitrospira sp.]|nr:MAG: response regulator transcription factor [Nitrospira sp.]
MNGKPRGRPFSRSTIEPRKIAIRHPRASHPIRVLIAHGQELVRLGVRAMLDGEEDFVVVGKADSSASTMSNSRRGKADVALIDPHLLDGFWTEAYRQPCKVRHDTRITVVTTMPCISSAFNAVAERGAYWYELREMSRTELLHAIRVVAGRAPSVHSEMADQTVVLRESRLHVLSPQEQRMMPLVADGKTNQEIAVELALSPKTVKNYMTNMFKKLQVARRAQAAALYVRELQHRAQWSTFHG